MTRAAVRIGIPIRAAAFACLLASAAPAAETRPNILLIVADDLGVDRVAAYGEHPDPGSTPVLDSLAAHGLLFRNAWSNPVCSPTRATLLTGQYAFRTGVGGSVPFLSDTATLPGATLSVAEHLRRAAGYRTALIGKWHLSTLGGDGYMHPIHSGFERHLGQIESFVEADGPGIYTSWLKNVADVHGATQVPVEGYATSVEVDDALAVIDDFGEDPWFVWLAFHAPHKPFHVPPAALHDIALSGTPQSEPALHQQAAISAMDTEIGRLLASIRPAVLERTLVVFVGDNGSSGTATTPPFVSNKAKGTVHEGGINVPLIVAGAGVQEPGREVTGLVNLTDLYATFGELAGARPVPGLDSVSLQPYLATPGLPSRRAWVFSERFGPNGPGPYEFPVRAVRGPRFKLVRSWNAAGVPKDVLYDLEADPFESLDLFLLPWVDPEAGAAAARLGAVLDRLLPAD